MKNYIPESNSQQNLGNEDNNFFGIYTLNLHMKDDSKIVVKNRLNKDNKNPEIICKKDLDSGEIYLLLDGYKHSN